jgi:exonuclease III
LRLDAVFASPAIPTYLKDCNVSASVTVEEASDHLPVWARFE